MTKVLILKGDSYKSVGELFAKHGYDVLYDAENLSATDCVVFTGGSDVSPYIYGEEPSGARGCNPVRDELERSIFHECVIKGIPMIGICRGGQLLNVLNGGTMIQDIGLVSGDVDMSLGFGSVIEVRVDHHQGMIYGLPSETFGWFEDHNDWVDYEIYYPKTKSLCVQYHPEWGHRGTEDRFFDLIKKTGVLNAS